MRIGGPNNPNVLLGKLEAGSKSSAVARINADLDGLQCWLPLRETEPLVQIRPDSQQSLRGTEWFMVQGFDMQDLGWFLEAEPRHVECGQEE